MIHVIDDFYDNIEDVVQLSKTLPYKHNVGGEHFLRTCELPCRVTGQRIAEILNIEMDWDDLAWNGDKLNGSFYKPRKDFISDHLHHDWYEWGGIVYLNDDLPPTFGTQFWRVVETREYYADTSKEYDHRANRDNQNNGFFEKTDYVSNKFNRLVLFRGTLFHSATVPRTHDHIERVCQFWQIRGK